MDNDIHKQQRKVADDVMTSTMLATSVQNLETAKLAHKKMTEQISMRTATVAQMACCLLASPRWPASQPWGTDAAVEVAEEIMAAAEYSAVKAHELQQSLEAK